MSTKTESQKGNLAETLKVAFRNPSVKVITVTAGYALTYELNRIGIASEGGSMFGDFVAFFGRDVTFLATSFFLADCLIREKRN